MMRRALAANPPTPLVSGWSPAFFRATLRRPLIAFRRHDAVAASGSSSAFNPSSIVVRSFSCRRALEEMRKLVGVCRAITLEEEVQRQIAHDGLRRARDDLGRPRLPPAACRSRAPRSAGRSRKRRRLVLIWQSRLAVRIVTAVESMSPASATRGRRGTTTRARSRRHRRGSSGRYRSRSACPEDPTRAPDVRRGAPSRLVTISTRRADLPLSSRPSRRRTSDRTGAKPIMQVTPARATASAQLRARPIARSTAFRRKSACSRPRRGSGRHACRSTSRRARRRRCDRRTLAPPGGQAPSRRERLRCRFIDVDDIPEANAASRATLPRGWCRCGRRRRVRRRSWCLRVQWGAGLRRPVSYPMLPESCPFDRAYANARIPLTFR